MIDLYYAATPNGWKISIFLEEAGLPYTVRPVDLLAGEQLQPAFLAISPNNRIPAIVDHAPADGGPPLAVFESGAILQYLADKTGLFLPAGLRGRQAVMPWVWWQAAGLGPMAGQNGHFLLYAQEKIPYAIDRFSREVDRLYGVLDAQLQRTGAHVVGDAFTIADMAIFPWVRTHKAQQVPLAERFPHVQRWYDALFLRPGVRRGLAVGKRTGPLPDDLAERRRALFGQTAETVRAARAPAATESRV